MSGTILKVTTRGTAGASKGSAKRLLLRAVHAGGQATRKFNGGRIGHPVQP